MGRSGSQEADTGVEVPGGNRNGTDQVGDALKEPGYEVTVALEEGADRNLQGKRQGHANVVPAPHPFQVSGALENMEPVWSIIESVGGRYRGNRYIRTTLNPLQGGHSLASVEVFKPLDVNRMGARAGEGTCQRGKAPNESRRENPAFFNRLNGVGTMTVETQDPLVGIPVQLCPESIGHGRFRDRGFAEQTAQFRPSPSGFRGDFGLEGRRGLWEDIGPVATAA